MGIGHDFMQKTRYPHLGISDQQKGVPQPPLFREGSREGAEYWLPPPRKIAPRPVDFTALVNRRQTLRDFTDHPFTLEELSFLLWCTQGVKEVHGDYISLRTVPSAGARHALETYLLVNKVDGLVPGLFYFQPREHRLKQLADDPDLPERTAAACHFQDFIRTSAVTFVWVAVPYRMTWRYGERGYRYLHLDAGHVCQNFYLAAEAIGAGACAVASFDDEAMGRLLGLNSEEELVIYLAAAGKRASGG